MYRVRVKRSFSSAHFLRNYKGKCENLHGHNWIVFVEVERENLDSSGMVMDFKELKEKLNEVLNKLDHKVLNEMDFFKKENPTAENIARFIYLEIKEKLPAKVKKVEVRETPENIAIYIPE